MKRLLAFALAFQMLTSAAFAGVAASADELDTVSAVQTEDTAQADDEAPMGDGSKISADGRFRYFSGDYGLRIVDYLGDETNEVVIPDTIDGKTVTIISDHAFIGRDFEKVVLPETLIRIEEGAFLDMQNLKEITIPKSVEVIENGAFGATACNYFDEKSGSDGYMGYQYHDFTVRGYVGSAADEYALRHAKISFVPVECDEASSEYFDYEENADGGMTITKIHTNDLPDVVVIPEKINGKTVTEIADCASSYKWKNDGNEDNELKYENFGFKPRTVVLNPGLKRVGGGAFGYVYAKTVYLPASIIPNIDSESFALKNNERSDIYDNWVDNALYYNYTVRMTDSINEDPDSIWNYSVIYGSDDFYGHKYGLTADGFKYMLLDNGSVGLIGYYGDKKIVYINTYIDGLPVKEIGRVFEKSDITQVSVPKTVKTISYGAFSNCRELHKVEFRTGSDGRCALDQISGWSFEGCTSLESITIPANVSYVSDACGLGMLKIENNSLDSDCHSEICYECDDNEPQTDADDNSDENTKETSDTPSNFVHIEPYDFYLFPFTIYGVRGSAVQTYADRFDTVTFVPIDEDDLPEKYNDLKYVVTQNGEVSITGAKEDAYNLVIPTCIPMTTVSGEREITAVADGAFRDHKSLDSVHFDRYIYMNGRLEGVRSIGSYAFAGCDKLVNVDFTKGDVNPIIKTIGEGAFLDCPCLVNVKIPASVENIGDYAFGFLTDGDKMKLDPRFVIYGYTGTAAEEYADKFGITFESMGYKGYEYKILGQVKEFGDYGFAEITAYKGIEENVYIPETIDNASVRVIGERAFAYNCAVKQVYFPESVMYIKDEAFRGCEQLYCCQENQSGNLVHIGKYAFAECSNLNCFVLNSDTLKFIGDNAFGFSSYTIFDRGDRVVAESEDRYEVLLTAMDYSAAAVEYARKHSNITFDYDYDIRCVIFDIDGESMNDSDSNFTNTNYDIVYKNNQPDHAVYNRRFSAEGEITTIDDNVYYYDNDDVKYIPVTEINKDSFVPRSGEDGLSPEIIVIGNNITKLDKDTFCNCSGTKEYYIPASVEEIEENSVGYYSVVDNSETEKTSYYPLLSVVIYGYDGTAAESYAHFNGFAFCNLGRPHITENTDTPYVVRKKGDVNGDDKVTAKDGLLIQRYAIGLEKIDDIGLAAADVNEDGRVTAKDALEVLRQTIGKKSIYFQPSY